MDGGPNKKNQLQDEGRTVRMFIEKFLNDAYSLVNLIEPTENLTNILQYDQINKAIFSYGSVSNL